MIYEHNRTRKMSNEDRRRQFEKSMVIQHLFIFIFIFIFIF